VIILGLCELSAKPVIGLERQPSNIGGVGGPAQNSSGDKQQRRQSSILVTIGQGNHVERNASCTS
jgi:hypothetical protein